jgi:hypothetical protein
MNLGEIVWEGVDLVHVDQDRDKWRPVVNTVMNLRFDEFLSGYQPGQMVER